MMHFSLLVQIFFLYTITLLYPPFFANKNSAKINTSLWKGDPSDIVKRIMHCQTQWAEGDRVRLQDKPRLDCCAFKLISMVCISSKNDNQKGEFVCPRNPRWLVLRIIVSSGWVASLLYNKHKYSQCWKQGSRLESECRLVIHAGQESRQALNICNATNKASVGFMLHFIWITV